MLAQGSVLLLKELKVITDFGKDRMGQPGAEHFKFGYVVCFSTWIQVYLPSDISIFDVGNADIEVLFWKSISR